MFCPRCGSNQSDDTKFCKSCGGNLAAVRDAVATRDASGKIDWNRTWVAEMFLSGAEQQKRKRQIELEAGITPEIRRQREIKAGVITASCGIGISIFLYVLFEGIILSLNNAGPEKEILSRLWISGVIPFFVGLSLIINGMFVGRSDRRRSNTDSLDRSGALPASDTERFLNPPFSVTDQTTRQLKETDQQR
jgi:hypothetical protein